MAKGNRGGKRAGASAKSGAKATNNIKYLSADNVLYESSDEVLYVERLVTKGFGFS